MKAIYASKLYKTSTRKNKIHAAIQNPVNAELVSQLAKYLDEEYQTPEYLDGTQREAGQSEASMPSELDPGAGDDFSPSDNLVHVPSGGGGGLPPAPENPDMDPFSDAGEGGEDLGDDSGSEPESAADELPDEPIEESTKVMGCTNIDSSAIKGALNAQHDTAGVNRILTKENELWVYYNDDINLNNVMTQVIEYLNASGYTYLEFNRLARSDNAIVFQIIESQPIKSVEELDEQK